MNKNRFENIISEIVHGNYSIEISGDSIGFNDYTITLRWRPPFTETAVEVDHCHVNDIGEGLKAALRMRQEDEA